MKTTIIKVLLSTSMIFFSASTFADHQEAGGEKAKTVISYEAKTVIGYDTTEGTRADLYAGSLDTIEVWTKYMKAHDDNDLDAIRAANAEGFKAWASDGSVLESTDAQINLLKDWFATSSPKWEHRYSMANEFTDKDGKLQQWVTTGWEMTETVDGEISKRQEIFDVLIENGKIKTIYIAARPILTAE